jgi:hypothetical protein
LRGFRALAERQHRISIFYANQRLSCFPVNGLQTFDSAKLLADKCLNHPLVVTPSRTPGLHPFTEGGLKLVWEATKPRPRWFLRVLHDLLQLGKDAHVDPIDETFIKPKLEGLSMGARTVEPGDGPSGDDRLA